MKTVTTLIQTLTTQTPNLFNIVFTTTDEEPVTVNILDPLKLIYGLNRKYADWKMYLPDWDIEELSGTFMNTWLYWKNANIDNIERMFNALIDSKYNPIENYDRHEDSTLKADNTTKIKQNVTNTTSYGENGLVNESSFSNDRKDTTTTYASTYESINANQQTAKSETVPKGKETNTTKGTITNTTSMDDTQNQNRTDTNASTNRHIHGNIGVTTAQQMINEELRLRITNNLTDIVIEMFAKEHFILWGDD